MPEATPDPEVETAIERVLAAEREALADIDAARLEGERLHARAALAAQAVKRRNERRIASLHAAFERHTQADIDAIERQIAGASAAPVEVASDVEAIGRAVAGLAALLTGEADHD